MADDWVVKLLVGGGYSGLVLKIVFDWLKKRGSDPIEMKAINDRQSSMDKRLAVVEAAQGDTVSKRVCDVKYKVLERDVGEVKEVLAGLSEGVTELRVNVARVLEKLE